MGRKRKQSREGAGGDGDGPRMTRQKRRTVAAETASPTGTDESPPDSDTAAPEVDKIMKVELEAESDPGEEVPTKEELFGNSDNLDLASDPDIDIGEVDLMRVPKEELIFEDEDVGVMDSIMITDTRSIDPNIGENDHGFPSTSTTSDSGSLVSPAECGNDTGGEENNETSLNISANTNGNSLQNEMVGKQKDAKSTLDHVEEDTAATKTDNQHLIEPEETTAAKAAQPSTADVGQGDSDEGFRLFAPGELKKIKQNARKKFRALFEQHFPPGRIRKVCNSDGDEAVRMMPTLDPITTAAVPSSPSFSLSNVKIPSHSEGVQDVSKDPTAANERVVDDISATQDKDTEIARLKAELQATTDRNEVLQRQVDSKNLRIDELSKKIKLSEDEVRSCTAPCQGLEGDLAETKGERDKLRRDLQTKNGNGEGQPDQSQMAEGEHQKPSQKSSTTVERLQEHFKNATELIKNAISEKDSIIEKQADEIRVLKEGLPQLDTEEDPTINTVFPKQTCENKRLKDKDDNNKLKRLIAEKDEVIQKRTDEIGRLQKDLKTFEEDLMRHRSELDEARKLVDEKSEMTKSLQEEVDRMTDLLKRTLPEHESQQVILRVNVQAFPSTSKTSDSGCRFSPKDCGNDTGAEENNETSSNISAHANGNSSHNLPYGHQPINTTDNEKITEQQTFPRQIGAKPVFTLSALSDQEKSISVALITALGGSVSSLAHYDPNCTALVTKTLLRTEKVLCCIAAGKYLLKYDYLLKCDEEQQFIPVDETYLWHEDNIYQPKEKDLAKCSFNWLKAQLKDKNVRPMSGKRFYFIRETIDKLSAYTRLVVAGGGEVVETLDEANVVIGEEKISLPEGVEQHGLIYLFNLVLSYPST